MNNEINISLPVLNIENLNSCTLALKSSLDKGVVKGLYDIKEVEQILFCLNGLNKCVQTLDNYQKYISSLTKEKSETKQNVDKKD